MSDEILCRTCRAYRSNSETGGRCCYEAFTVVVAAIYLCTRWRSVGGQTFTGSVSDPKLARGKARQATEQ